MQKLVEAEEDDWQVEGTSPKAAAVAVVGANERLKPSPDDH